MACGTVFSQIQIEAVVFFVQTKLLHSLHQLAIVVFTLASADDLADAGNQTVHSGHRLVVVVHLHIECFDLLRIIGHEDRAFEDLLGQVTLMLGLEIASPGYFIFEFVVVLFQKFNCFGVGDMAEIRAGHMVQAFQQALVNEGIKEVHFFRRMLQNIADNIFQHCFRQIHIVLQICESHLRLDHPEFSRMAGGIGIFRTESRSEGVDVAEGLGESFAV